MRNWRNEEATARTGSSCGNSGGKEMEERSGGGREMLAMTMIKITKNTTTTITTAAIHRNCSNDRQAKQTEMTEAATTQCELLLHTHTYIYTCTCNCSRGRGDCERNRSSSNYSL